MLRRLLAEATDSFLANDYLKAPRVFRGSAADVVPLVSAAVLEALVCTPEADLLVVQDGKPYGGARPSALEEARALLASGHTLAFRDPNHHDEALRELSRSLAADLQAWPNVHVYWTPPGKQGFTWHFDPEEVFIVQISGRKTYRARPSRRQPNPTEEMMGDTRPPPGEDPDELTVELTPGDCLYLPGGIWHSARAVEESVSLSLGMMPATVLDALDYVRKALVQSPQWRRRLAPLGRRSPLPDAEQIALCQQLFSELASTVSAQLTSPQFALQFLADAARTFMAQQPPTRIAPRPRGR